MSTITRRQALGAAAGVTAALATAGAAQAIPVSQVSPVTPAPASPATPASADAPEPFDEVYRGRRIQGGASHDGGHGDGHHAGHGGGYSVRIDGEELHVMQNADGTWISVVNHYEPLATPRATARAAVVELQGADLVPLTLS
ncbi:apotyrosinase chaperone MelC1 [Streptomyces sp. FIT100]|uniref:apotyrosinase chaperone MelC1 n=1 Tax=Streptomyces sp. FIT100 TaxID=2837956 RepID=UPI0021C6A1B2|nr:tyrosinase cofactor [Streptomyces sp. FIT100]UUN30529.1 twin-arginine translocation signal domain-containing protein [Streptomyces sp. FIT100]